MAAKKKVKKVSEKSTLVSSTPTNSSSLMLLSLACAVLILSYFIFIKVSHEAVNSSLQMGIAMPSNQMTVQLNEQNNSGEYGNALITESEGKVHVHVSIKNAPKGVSQPAHIHVGTCIDLGAVKYPLTNLVNGISDTTINVSLKDLEAQGPLVLNVHKSVSQSNQYVSCGNL